MTNPNDHPQNIDGPGVYVNVHIHGAGVAWSNAPEMAWEAITEIEQLLTTMAEDLGGEMLANPGDTYRIRFTNAAPAVMWCARMQEGLLTLDWPEQLSGPVAAIGGRDQLSSGLLAIMAIHDGDPIVLSQLTSLTQPGQVLITGPCWDTVKDPLPPDLRVQSMGSAILSGKRIEIHQVTTRLLSRRRFNELAAHPSGLPVEPDCYIGRKAAMADLMERLNAGAHMVNITGDEGVGKTRLAMKCIREIQEENPGGVALVSLRHIQDDTEVLLATAAALGMALGTELNRTIEERIGHAIATRGRSIILFDGFESHLDSRVLDTWVRTATETRFLVTGRDAIESERATHLHLGPMTQADAKALFLCRTHRAYRAKDRPSHASHIEVHEAVDSKNPYIIEQATGVSTPLWDGDARSSLALRRVALDTSALPAERVTACLELAPSLLRMGLSGVASELLQAVEPLLPQTELVVPWKYMQADILLAEQNFHGLHALFDETNIDDRTSAEKSQWLLRQGKLALAEERFSDAKEILDEATTLGESSEIAHARGKALAAMDEWEGAVEWLEIAANQLVNPLARAHALGDLGRVLQDLGRETEADTALTEAIHIGGQDPHVMAKVLHHRFQGATARLALDEARTYLLQELDCLKRCGDQAGYARAHIQVGLLDLIQHRPSDAVSHFLEARDLCREAGLSNIEAHALTLGGVAARLSGDFGSALDAFAEAAALVEGQHQLLAIIHAHRGAVEAACDAVDNAVTAFAMAETHLESEWDALASTIHDVLAGFIDLARARDAALVEDTDGQAAHVDAALNRLARGSSFETRSTPPRGREVPSRINELRLARLLLDGALSTLEMTE